MEKKELPKKNFEPKSKPESKGSGPAKPAWISNKVFDVIKLLLGICLLPFIYSCSVALLRQLNSIDMALQNYFWAGVITLVVVYLFIWEPAKVYEKGHRLLELLFSFFQPLVKVAPYLLPIYLIIVSLLYAFLCVFIKSNWLIYYTMFLFGLSISLHLVLWPGLIRAKKGDLLKSNYIFGFSFVYILNIGLLALILNFMFVKFSFVKFSNETYFAARDIFKAVLSQLFIV